MRAAALLALAGCGRIGFDDRPSATRDASQTVIDATPDASAFDPALCPGTYTITVPSTTTRYRYASDFLGWVGANAACVADATSPIVHTHLAVFASQQEHDEIAAMFDDFWVGYSDRVTEGTVRAVTLEPLGNYLQSDGPAWFPGEPNDQGGSEDCIHIKVEGGLNDADCVVVRDRLCECDAYLNTPSQYAP